MLPGSTRISLSGPATITLSVSCALWTLVYIVCTHTAGFLACDAAWSQLDRRETQTLVPPAQRHTLTDVAKQSSTVGAAATKQLASTTVGTYLDQMPASGQDAHSAIDVLHDANFTLADQGQFRQHVRQANDGCSCKTYARHRAVGGNRAPR